MIQEKTGYLEVLNEDTLLNCNVDLLFLTGVFLFRCPFPSSFLHILDESHEGKSKCLETLNKGDLADVYVGLLFEMETLFVRLCQTKI